MNKKNIVLVISLACLILIGCTSPKPDEKVTLANKIEAHLKQEVLDKWYPLAVDTLYGGFLSSFTFDFKPTDNQNKMIVTQSRHTWANAKASELFPEEDQYLSNAQHGFYFLRDVMWDSEAGGFYTLVSRDGKPSKQDSIKTAYGNAFGIFALAAYYKASGDTSALSLAKKTFWWLENGSHDSKLLGYFQHLNRFGIPIKRPANTSSFSDLGYKDQNSSIHLLEAFTELYQVWPDKLVKERLAEMLYLIRDTIVDERGSLTLFLQPDWTPVTFQDSSKESILEHARLNHVSFGHDVETAFLLLEASETLQIKNDTATERISKKMFDHSLKNGWDNTVGGFYDEGYYFIGEPQITIIRDSKNWWAQAEGMNTLLLMAEKYPGDELNYYQKFLTQWNYCDTYLIDHEFGDWFSGGLDKQPEMKSALKGNIWKANYHQFRSLMHCAHRLKNMN